MNSTFKTVVLWVTLVVVVVVLWRIISSGTNSPKDAEINYSEFMSQVDQGAVNDVTIVGTEVHGHYKDKDNKRKLFI